MITANKAVRLNLTSILNTIILVLGFILLISCLNVAINHKQQIFSNSDAQTTSARNIEKQLNCLSRNIYWEAASEPFEGKVAVAQVTLNRMRSGKFPDSICGVVYQKTTFVSKTVCQFSWFCETNHVTRPVSTKLYKESEEVAKMVMLEGFSLPTLKEALYYHADYVNPRWKKEKITQIGRHIFYKDI